MKRISTTSLEQFRRYISGTSIFDTEEKLLEVLSGAFTGNQYTYIGTAFHSLVECGIHAVSESNDKNDAMVCADGHSVWMDENQVQTALDYRKEVKSALHEVPIGMDFLDGRFPIHVTGRIDLLHGNDIRDIKTKYSRSEASDYIDSYQWRLYLQMTGAERFYFDVFEFAGYDKERHGIDVRGLKLTRTDTIECLRYDTLEQDNRILLDEFREYIHHKNIYHLLKEKQ